MSETVAAQVFMLPELARRAVAEYGTLKAWERQGLIAPSIRPTEGSGRPGLYNAHDAEIVVSLVNLRRRRGINMVALGVVAAAWRAGDLPECPICDRTELKLPVSAPTGELKEHDHGE